MESLPTTDAGLVVVGIGEALFDCLPNGLVLGGAPVNFTVHIQRLLSKVGGSGILVSRVGDDDLGKRIISELQSREVSTELVQTDPNHSTGKVVIQLSDDGQPEYTIEENVAWDHLAADAALDALAAKCDAVCFGTLAQRHAVSRATIQRFASEARGALRVLDVNLRQSYFTKEILRQSFEMANVVKLNLEELSRIAELFCRSISDSSRIHSQVQELIMAFDLKAVILTRGSQGTVLYTEGEVVAGTPVDARPAPGADSVGAGDACCAGIVYGLLKRWPLTRVVELANQLGAFVASQPGATPKLPTSIIETV